jgi:hypothetical protein
MNKTVLVIGSVTAKQYEEARLSILQQGDKPKVVRTTSKQFFLDDSYVSEVTETTDEQNLYSMSAEDMDSLEGQFVASHLEQFGEIAAIVMDEESWNDWDRDYCYMLLDALDENFDFKRWLVHTDGNVEPLD